jgi:hypothetical protein
VELEFDEVDSGTAELVAVQTVLLRNSGKVAAQDLSFRAWVDDQSKRVGVESKYQHLSIRKTSTRRIKLEFHVDDVDFHSQGTLEVDAARPAGTKPTSVRLTLRRAVDEESYLGAVQAAGALSLLTLALSATMTTFNTRPEDPEGIFLWLRRRKWWRFLARKVITGAAWTFKDSWATNLTAVGAVLATALAASGLLDRILPGVPQEQFAALNILFGAMVLVAPLLYAALGRRELDKDGYIRTLGTLGGLYLSSAITLFAVYAQLMTLLALLFHTSTNPSLKTLFSWLIGAAILGAAIYGIRSVKSLAEAKIPPVTTQVFEGAWVQRSGAI